MLKIAVIEDAIEDYEKLKSCLDEIGKKNNLELSIVWHQKIASFFMTEDLSYDIVFFDVELPDGNGVEAGIKYRKMNSEVIIIFVTALAQYAIEGYEAQAMDYILKPIQPANFMLKMESVFNRAKLKWRKSITINNEGNVYKVPVSDIFYVEIQGHYISYHTASGVYSEYATLKDAEAKINESCFVRCNRCYLVNLTYVKSIRNDFVVVNQDELIISRPQKKAFLDAMNQFITLGKVNVK